MYRHQLTKEERLNWLRLIRTSGIGIKIFYRLVGELGTATHAINALADIMNNSRRKKPIRALAKSKVLEEMEKVENFGARIVTIHDDEYPPLLRSIDDAPPVLTIKGNPNLCSKSGVGIVGSRKCSAYGTQLAEHWAREMGKARMLVVSGLAKGIDRHAHLGSLEKGTVGVIAGGINSVYPQDNADLYEIMSNRGAIISEMPFDTPPQATFFPRRNRIISGMTRALIVIEARAKSGSLITARMSLEYNRDLFVVNHKDLNGGILKMVDQGAYLVDHPIEAIKIIKKYQDPKAHTNIIPIVDNKRQITTTPKIKPKHEAVDLQDHILALLKENARDMSVSEIIILLKVDSSDVNMALIELELNDSIIRGVDNTICIKL